jgi:uncharacterized SAM-binding protein YcdF (DUF218 family)
MTRRSALVAAFVVFTLYVAGLHFFVKDALSLPQTAAEKRDAIVVLTGGSNRLDAGFDLLQHGMGKKLFISGVYRGTEISNLLKLWRSEPQNNLDCCVALGFNAENTVGNARETTTWLKQQKYKSIYLVTSNYHIRRALLEFNRYDSGLDIMPYAVPPAGMDIGTWWKDDNIRGLVLREYTKYVAAYIAHGVLRL